MKKAKSNGFTLIELLIVSALIALAFFFVTIKLDLNSIKLKSEASNIVSALRYTRQLDTNGESDQKFVMTVENGEIYYSVSNMLNERKTYLKNKIDKNIIVQKKMAADIDEFSIGDENSYSKVSRDGNSQFQSTHFTPNAAIGGGTIILETIRSRKIYKITIVPTSGRIYLYEIKR